MESVDTQALFDLGFVVALFIAFSLGFSKGGAKMTYEDAVFVLGSLFGLYIVGWGAGFTIYMIKVYLEKI